MKPIRTPQSNTTLTLPGGTAENDLPATRAMLTDDRAGAEPAAGWITTWMPDEEEAARLEAGGAVELIVWGTVHPPTLVRVTDAVIPERELVDRGHVDRAIGFLYAALLEREMLKEYDTLDAEVMAPSEFADLWIEAVDATKTDRTDPTDNVIALPSD